MDLSRRIDFSGTLAGCKTRHHKALEIWRERRDRPAGDGPSRRRNDITLHACLAPVPDEALDEIVARRPIEIVARAEDPPELGQHDERDEDPVAVRMPEEGALGRLRLL
jgi:hypothetical protein